MGCKVLHGADEKRQGAVSMNLILNFAKEMTYLDKLAKELVNAGISKNVKKVEDGVWNRDMNVSR